MTKTSSPLEKPPTDDLILQTKAHFDSIDAIDAAELLRDIESVIKAAVSMGKSKILVFSNNYPHVIRMAIDSLNAHDLQIVGVQYIQVINPTPELRVRLERRLCIDPIALIVEQVNSRYGLAR
jgi:hypothetical protein